MRNGRFYLMLVLILMVGCLAFVAGCKGFSLTPEDSKAAREVAALTQSEVEALESRLLADSQDLAQKRIKLEAEAAALAKQKAEAETALAAAPDDGKAEASAEVAKLVAELRDAKAALVASTKQADDVATALKGVQATKPYIDTVKSAVDAGVPPGGGEPDLAKGLQPLTGLLPPPFGTILYSVLTLGGAGLAAYKAYEKDKAARSIINALDAARAASPSLKAEMTAQKKTIDAQLTPKAKALINAETTTG